MQRWMRGAWTVQERNMRLSTGMEWKVGTAIDGGEGAADVNLFKCLSQETSLLFLIADVALAVKYPPHANSSPL